MKSVPWYTCMWNRRVCIGPHLALSVLARISSYTHKPLYFWKWVLLLSMHLNHARALSSSWRVVQSSLTRSHDQPASPSVFIVTTHKSMNKLAWLCLQSLYLHMGHTSPGLTLGVIMHCLCLANKNHWHCPEREHTSLTSMSAWYHMPPSYVSAERVNASQNNPGSKTAVGRDRARCSSALCSSPWKQAASSSGVPSGEH